MPTVLPAKKVLGILSVSFCYSCDVGLAPQDAADRCVSVRGVNGSLHAEFESAVSSLGCCCAVHGLTFRPQEQLNTWIVALHSLIQSSGKQVRAVQPACPEVGLNVHALRFQVAEDVAVSAVQRIKVPSLRLVCVAQGISMFTIIFGSAAVGAAILFSGRFAQTQLCAAAVFMTAHSFVLLSAFLPTYLVFRELFLQRPAVAEVKVKDS